MIWAPLQACTTKFPVTLYDRIVVHKASCIWFENKLHSKKLLNFLKRSGESN